MTTGGSGVCSVVVGVDCCFTGGSGVDERARVVVACVDWDDVEVEEPYEPLYCH